MASFFYNLAAKKVFDRSLDLTGTLKLMLVNNAYTPNRDDDFVDAGGASDAVDAEIVATNYVRGWGGSGRKTPVVSFAEQDANDRAVIIINDVTWTTLGGAANDTVVGAILVKEGGANDTDSLLIVYFDVTDTLTSGTDFILDFDVNGNVRIKTA